MQAWVMPLADMALNVAFVASSTLSARILLLGARLVLEQLRGREKS